MEYNEYCKITNQKQWMDIMDIIDKPPNMKIPKKIPFNPTYIKYVTFVSNGTLLTYSDSNKKGISLDFIPNKLKKISIIN